MTDLARTSGLLLFWTLFVVSGTGLARQETGGVELVRPPAPPLDDFETDDDSDGVPDGWYNVRDAHLVEGGIVGPRMIRFQADRPSRPARMSRGFGVDGRKVEAIVVGLWVRQKELLPGERIGEDPGLMIDFLDSELQSTSRGVLGPWTRSQGEGWVHWRKRLPVGPATRDAILTVGLLGGTGTLEIDGLSIEPIPAGGSPTSNLIVNGDFELGGLKPDHWIIEGEARRTFPGVESTSALTLGASGAKALAPLGIPIKGAAGLRVELSARGDSLRGSGGGQAGLYFLDVRGDRLPGNAGGVRLFRWSGSFDWKRFSAVAAVPVGAVQAVLQVENNDPRGKLSLDRVEAMTESNGGPSVSWVPYHESNAEEDWVAYTPTTEITAGSALDFSRRLEAPAGKRGFVVSQKGRLTFSDGSPARFLGVTLFPPLAFSSQADSDRLADRLARSGVNLVRLGDLDSPLGLGTSLLDDTSDDTVQLDSGSLSALDHLIAALKRRGVYIALELQGQVRLRDRDGVPEPRMLGAGGGPAAAFHPALRKRLETIADALLSHVNPETGLALRDDPALVWVTLAGEVSLFDLIDDPERLPDALREDLREQISASRVAAGRQGWQRLEQEHWGEITRQIRSKGLKSLVAGSSHWRREAEYIAAQASDPLNLIDDRLYWHPSGFGDARYRAALFDGSGTGLLAMSERKRRADRPYVVGQYASNTMGAPWLPGEGGDLILAACLASRMGWDALVRRGVARFPEAWGASATGTGGGPDVFPLQGAFNGNPQVFALLPHASLLVAANPGARNAGVRTLPGWNATAGILRVDQSSTQGAVGLLEGEPMSFGAWDFRAAAPLSHTLLSSVDGRPLDRAGRMLLTSIARAEPTGIEWVDSWRREVADPGRSPILLERVGLSVTWKRPGQWIAYPLDASGNRMTPVPLSDRGRPISLSDSSPPGTIHWEIVEVEPK